VYPAPVVTKRVSASSSSASQSKGSEQVGGHSSVLPAILSGRTSHRVDWGARRASRHARDRAQPASAEWPPYWWSLERGVSGL